MRELDDAQSQIFRVRGVKEGGGDGKIMFPRWSGWRGHPTHSIPLLAHCGSKQQDLFKEVWTPAPVASALVRVVGDCSSLVPTPRGYTCPVFSAFGLPSFLLAHTIPCPCFLLAQVMRCER
jgi:hypothetical protein